MPTPTWDLQETRNLVRNRFGEKQLELARQSLGSTIDRREYARFHYHEAKDVIETRIGTLHKGQRLFVAMLGGETNDEQLEFEDSLAKVSAHVVACVQSLHAIADIFAHAIYYSLGYNLRGDALTERRVAAHSVRDKLRINAAHHRLADGLNELISNEHSEYLAALANQSKHRSLVKPALWLDMTEVAPEPFTLQFQDFTYDGTFYERREIQPFLESAFNQISQIIIDTGIKLNAALRVKSL